jgi:hypothetical protein
MLVDLTPPQPLEVSTVSRERYQSRDDLLDFVLHFDDPESGIDHYRCVVYQKFQVGCTIVVCLFSLLL